VTTPCAGIADQVIADVNALVFGIDDATSLALRVSSLLDDEERRSRMGRNSRSIFDCLLQYDEMVERYERLILGAWLRAPRTEGPVDWTATRAERRAAVVG
jgi:glycosyltransferase involved in cell wall biosynthesis